MALIAYDCIKMILNEFKIDFRRQKFTSTKDTTKKFQENVQTCSLVVDMIMKAEQAFKLSDNWEAMKEQIELFQEKLIKFQQTGLMTSEQRMEQEKQLTKLEQRIDKLDDGT